MPRCARRHSCARSRASWGSTSQPWPAAGPQGRITEDDVRGAAALRREGRREPLRGVRRLTAEHMARAHREVAPVTWVEECDFGNVDLKLLVAATLRAAALALKDFPELNARLEGDEIVYLDRYDLGFAVQTDQGLVVPVVRDAGSRSLDELDADVRRLADDARAGRLKPEDLRGSTFTITSAGKLAGLFQTPIVNHPEVAILSLGRVGRAAGRPRRRGRGPADRLRGAHLRPPRRRRRPRGRVRSRRHRAAPERREPGLRPGSRSATERGRPSRRAGSDR